MNKKGDVSDGIVFIIVIFFLAVSFVAVAFVTNEFKNAITDTPLNDTTASSAIVEGLDNLNSTGIQRGFGMVFVFLIIGMMLSSFLVRVHPAWIFLYILFLVFAIIVTVPLANIYNEMISNTALSEIANQQTIINWVMFHSVQILIGSVILSMIILFAKPPEVGQV